MISRITALNTAIEKGKAMHFDLPQGVLNVLERLNAAGYQAYAVGGCVRDLARGVPPHDYDICTSALPEQTEQCFSNERVVETGLKHGTVTVVMADEPYEITTFRTDGDYLDGRHPESVAFTDSLTEDLRRRDFTINAMAFHPKTGLCDPFGGLADIDAHIIRCVGDANKRFTEDALRILRALRFASELQFDIVPDTACAMRTLCPRLSMVSRERIAGELLRTLNGKNAVPVLRNFDCVLLAALPDYPADALPHALDLLAAMPCGDTVLRTAALLTSCGADAARVLDSLKLSRIFARQVLELIDAAAETINAKELPLWLSRLGETQLRRLLILQQREDLLGCLPDILAQDLPLKLSDLAVNGKDLILAGINPGADVGQTLQKLHRKVLLGELPNEKKALLGETEETAREQLPQM